MLHGSMLRRKRSMLHTYVLLLWLVAMETVRIAARLVGDAFRLPMRLLHWCLSLRHPLLQLLPAAVAKWRGGGGGGAGSASQRARRAIVVFTRLPNPGRTKSRLIPYIGPNNSALVMRVLTESLVRRLQPLRRRLPDADIYLAYKDQCHVICEPGVCNRPVQLWMECIDRHEPLLLLRPSPRHATTAPPPAAAATSGDEEAADASSIDGLRVGNGSNGHLVEQCNGGGNDSIAEDYHDRNGGEGDGDGEDDGEEFVVSDAMEMGAFERYLERLKSAASPPYASRYDPLGAPCRVSHLGPAEHQRRKGPGDAPANANANASSSSSSSSTTSIAPVSAANLPAAAYAAAPLPQSGSSIGATLESALWTLFGRGYSQVALLSSDVPSLTDRHAEQAISCLDAGVGLALGKTTSGGIYLLAADRRATRRHLGGLFRSIVWGTSTVFDAQADNALSLGVRCAVLRPILRDLDTIDDLGLLESELGIPSCLFMSDAVTVLIPARNEADHIETTLRNLLFNCSRNRPLQIVVVDGRSVDGTGRLVREFYRHRARACLPHSELRRVTMEVRRLPDSIPTGRGHMIRYGTRFARGAYYLVLHADSSLPENWDDIVVHALSKPGIVGGAFTFHLKIPNELCFTKDIPWALRTLLLELHTNWRCRHYEMPVGSQGMFVHAYYYAMSGGYKDWPFLEDIEFVERLKRLGHVAIADAAVMTSPRRWITHGFLAVCGLNALILMAYRMGVDAKKLGAIYYSVGKSWVRV